MIDHVIFIAGRSNILTRSYLHEIIRLGIGWDLASWNLLPRELRYKLVCFDTFKCKHTKAILVCIFDT